MSTREALFGNDAQPARATLLAMANAASIAVVVTDLRGVTRWVNPSMEKLSGYSLAELAGRTPGSVLQGAGTDLATASAMRDAVREQRFVHAEILNYHKSGSEYRHSIDILPLRDTAGLCIGFAGLQNDVTRRRQLEAQLRAAAHRDQQRLAADLHDGVGQQIAGLMLLAAASQATLRQRGHPGIATLDQITTTAQAVIRECRRMAIALPAFAAHAKDGHGVLASLVARMLGSAVNATVLWDASVTDALDGAQFDEVYRTIEDILQCLARDATLTSVAVIGRLNAGAVWVHVADRSPTPALATVGRGDARRQIAFRLDRLGGQFSISNDPVIDRPQFQLQIPALAQNPSARF